MDESRKQFEWWYLLNWGHTEDNEDSMFDVDTRHGNYHRLGVRMAYDAWTASRAAIEIELPPVCDAHSDDIDKGYDICHYRTQECLKKQGVRFKVEGAERWSQPSAPLESK